MYRVKYHKQVIKFLQNQPLALRQKVVETFEQLKRDPYQTTAYDIKPFKGFRNAFRLRIGKFRILYRIEKDRLLIYLYDAGSRRDIYK